MPHARHQQENFPVASRLCPPALRAPILAIYQFARTADDLADEGDRPAGERRALLEQMRVQLAALPERPDPAAAWTAPLAQAIATHELPKPLLADLLSAFEQDTWVQRYPDRAALLDYCRRSANPVGRLLLHLYRIDDAQSLWQSDQICTALQLINFWQDLGRDIARGRWYPSTEQMERHGVSADDLRHDRPCAGASRMVADYAAAARARMLQGMPLARRIGGRAGWELRLVIAGGLRIVDKMASLDHATWRHRPKLGKRDLPWLLWRAATLPLSGNGAPA